MKRIQRILYTKVLISIEIIMIYRVMITTISLKFVRFCIVFGIVKVCDRQWFFCNFSTLKYLKMFC